jgi:hypothetical protein
MAVFRRGRVYWYHFTFRGRRIQESSGFQNKTAALRVEAKRKADLLDRRGGISKIKPAPKFDEFVKHSLNGRNSNTDQRHTNCTLETASL